MPILQTKNLIKRFDGVHAVDNLSIGIEKGKITGIVGPNGSGKTTLINLLSGMLPIDGGAIFVDGVALQVYSRTHLKIPSSSRCERFSCIRKARRGSCSCSYYDDAATQRDEKISATRMGYGQFPQYLCRFGLGVHKAHLRPCSLVLRKLAHIASGGIFEMGSYILKNIGIDSRRPVRAEEVAAYGITRTFQNVRLFEQMTALDNILVVLTERNVFAALFEKHGAYHLKRSQEVLERVGLWEKRHQLAVNLSYGQRKLLEIARALAMTHSTAGQAEIFLFDEPFAGLFPEMRKIVAAVMKELRAEGKAVVLIEHDMGLIRELCDHVFVMDSGKLLAEGKPHEVLEKREVVEAYLGE